jgi:electron transfer flavoprotein beta subunit
MQVVVCCKGISIDSMLESIQIRDGDIHFENTELKINELDAYALETAVWLKDSYGVEPIGLTLGPLRAQEVLYYAVAKGIDKVLRIDGFTALPESIAYGLLPPLREIGPELVLVGSQSEDWMGGEVGIYISQGLDMGLAYAVVEICELTERYVRVKKEIGGGRTAEVRVGLPAVLCVQTGIRPLRYLSAMKKQKAREKSIKLWGKFDAGEARRTISDRMAYAVKAVSLPSKEGHAEMITGARSEKARAILEIISNTV